jgi:hypothetical protein
MNREQQNSLRDETMQILQGNLPLRSWHIAMTVRPRTLRPEEMEKPLSYPKSCTSRR